MTPQQYLNAEHTPSDNDPSVSYHCSGDGGINCDCCMVPSCVYAGSSSVSLLEFETQDDRGLISRRPSVTTLVAAFHDLPFPEDLPRELRAHSWLKNYSIQSFSSKSDSSFLPYTSRHSSTTAVSQSGEEIDGEATRSREFFYPEKDETFRSVDVPETNLEPLPAFPPRGIVIKRHPSVPHSQVTSRLPYSLVHSTKGVYPDWSVLDYFVKEKPAERIRPKIASAVKSCKKEWACREHQSINFACKDCNPSGEPMRFPF